MPGPPARIAVYEVGRSLVDRLADAGAVDAQAWKGVIQAADAWKQSFQGVSLNLTRGIVDDLPVQSREPVGACALDVLVVGNTQNVRAPQRVTPPRRPQRWWPVARCPVVWRPAGLRVIGGRDPGPETPCGADGYQRSDHCEQSPHSHSRLLDDASRLKLTLPRLPSPTGLRRPPE